MRSGARHRSDRAARAFVTAIELGWGRVMATTRRLLLTRREAAQALGMSLSHFQRHVQPWVPCVYSGHLRLYQPSDLERWVADHVDAGRRTIARAR
jgi:hypothetical protein